jgi:hypothetical protein
MPSSCPAVWPTRTGCALTRPPSLGSATSSSPAGRQPQRGRDWVDEQVVRCSGLVRRLGNYDGLVSSTSTTNHSVSSGAMSGGEPSAP